MLIWEINVELEKGERGKKLAASAHYRDVQIARDIAREIAAGGRVISASDVRAEMLVRFPDTDFGNWMGVLFAKCDDFRPVGFVQASSAGSRGRMVRTWTLRKEA